MMNEEDAPMDQNRFAADALMSALAASEARHRMISELISDYAYSMRVEQDGTLTQEWQAGNLSALTGYPDGALEPLDLWQKLIHPNDWPVISARMSAFFEGRPIVSEYRIFTANGNMRWLRDYGQPMCDEAGRLVRVFGALQDITEKKTAEDLLRHSEKEYRALFDLASTAKGQADPFTCRLLRVNQRLCEMVGHTREALLGMSFTDITHPDDHVIDQETHRLLIVEGGAHRSFNKRYIHKNGSIVYAHVELSLIRDPDGKPLHYVASIQDYTARQNAEAHIRFQAELLSAVQQAIIATDVHGTVTYWNPQAEALYGWLAGEALGRNIIDLSVTPGQAEVAGEIMAALAQGKVWVGEFDVQRRDGSTFPAEVADSPVIDDAGHVIGIIGISQDITERRRRQQNERMLAEIGQLLVQSLSIEQRIASLAELFVEQFAEVCTILLVDEAGKMVHFKAAHHNPALQPELLELSQYTPQSNPATATAQALRTGQPVFMPVVTQDFKQTTAANPRHAALREKLGFHSMITLPIIARGNILGSMTVARSAALPRFHEHDFTFLQEVSRRAALYLDNARLYMQTQAMNAELEQRVLLRTAALQESQMQLRQLTARVQTTREDERRRVAREVHDVIGQLLTSLKMEAGWLDLRLQEAESPLAGRTRRMIELLDSAFQSVRQIATDLRPTLLDDLGLIAAMEWQMEDFQTRTGIACRFESTLDKARLNMEASTALFRILQEALTNVARHAGATRVGVIVEEDRRGWLVLQIKDNGRGITEDEMRQTQSLGLVGMRERIHLLGGEIRINGKVGAGTTIDVRVPMAVDETDD
jgi:PAS domain S-box-containing protein